MTPFTSTMEIVQEFSDSHTTILQEMGTYTTNDATILNKRKGDDNTFQLHFDDGITDYDHLFPEQPEMDFNDDHQMKVVERARELEFTSCLNDLEAQQVCSQNQQIGGGLRKFELHFGDPTSNYDHLFHVGTEIDSNQVQPKKRVKCALKDPAAQSSVAPPNQKQRRMWVKNRSKIWWESCNNPDFPESEFKKLFRMSRATFDMICQKLDSTLIKKDTTLRLPIPVRQRVAVCIYRLATGDPLRQVSAQFGVGISTCHKLVLEVCIAIRSVLMPMFLKWPNEEKLKTIKHKFKSMSKIANIAGSIYTTHIPITVPKVNPALHFNKHHTERNQKSSYSITVQGVVDSKGIFTDISIGWPGSLTDAEVLGKSSLYINKSQKKNLWVVGNSGYPLTDWLLTPYTDQNLTWTQDIFNDALQEIQNIATSSFGRLKGRWICLQKRMELKLQDLPVVIGACCVLHNICEMRGEEMEPELKVEVFDDDMLPVNAVRSIRSLQIRDHIAHNLLHCRPQLAVVNLMS